MPLTSRRYNLPHVSFRRDSIGRQPAKQFTLRGTLTHTSIPCSCALQQSVIPVEMPRASRRDIIFEFVATELRKAIKYTGVGPRRSGGNSG